ncbi:molybdopterin-guanine dinucleotide biosynthesis protein B [Sporosarcina limicola]|uniref:Molybdopterin-guanine dinucleotide biosynthesis protein B n=1 Tax=Sporosarcina limicola TaxID=34101 RepID=A0A927RFS7_9BACL|nr:molybdopterin-guanine dinucleotide biosynthesis protein B [Sporosarcina limicola]MBE1555827.1 molybdopterin-guanine dinucleotide biosynthesis protein B [Sporosarcina limicola]
MKTLGVAPLKTLHVVGYKNSGKTTLLARWVRLLKKEGFTVAVLKHHGHSDPLSMPDSSTDTMQFFASGADVSAVSGGGAVQLLLNEELEFIRLKELVTLGNPDILFIEGYKEEQGDKVVLLRNEEEWDELRSLQGIQLVVGCSVVEASVPHIESRIEVERLDCWLLDWVGRE